MAGRVTPDAQLLPSFFVLRQRVSLRWDKGKLLGSDRLEFFVFRISLYKKKFGATIRSRFLYKGVQ